MIKFNKILTSCAAIVFLLLPTSALAAGKGTLTVTVTDATNTNFHPGASVLVTSRAGGDSISQPIAQDAPSTTIELSPGDYEYRIRSDGKYQPSESRAVTIYEGQDMAVNYALVPLAAGSTASPSPTGSSVFGSSGGAAAAVGSAAPGLLRLNTPRIFTDFTKLGEQFSNFENAVPALFTLLIYVAGIIFLLLFFVGGIQYLTSAGNEEASGKAKKLLVDAIIGLIIVLLAWAAGAQILNWLGLNII